jgi:hypothetical protein
MAQLDGILTEILRLPAMVIRIFHAQLNLFLEGIKIDFSAFKAFRPA